MAKPILVANWKNHPGSLPEARALLKNLARKKLLFKKLALFIAPPASYLETASQAMRSFAYLASQDLFPIERGSFTGALSVEILKSFGVRLSILGHSERRALGESSAQVSEKVKASLKAGIVPLVCVGEKVRDSEGEHFAFLQEQIKSSLAGLEKKELAKVILAYEPVWAIGEKAKEAIEPGDLAQTILFIRKVLSDLFGRPLAEKVPILYGGSVEPMNSYALMKDSGVRGFLVGRSSLDAKSFALVAEALISK